MISGRPWIWELYNFDYSSAQPAHNALRPGRLSGRFASGYSSGIVRVFAVSHLLFVYRHSGVKDTLKGLEKDMYNHHIHEKVQGTLNEPGGKKGLKRRSIHQIQPYRCKSDADDIFRQCTGSGAGFGDAGSVQVQSA